MITNAFWYNLIKESQTNEPGGFDSWLKINKPKIKISFAEIYLVFRNIERDRIQQSPSLNTRKVDLDGCTVQSTTENTKTTWDNLFTIDGDLEATDPISWITPSIARNILPGEAGVTVPKAQQCIIGSFGAALSVIISMYDKENKTCALAHVDVSENPIGVIDMLLCQLRTDKPGRLIVEMATGRIENNTTLEKLESIISEKKIIMSLQEIHHSESLAIDARTGETFRGIDAYSMDLGLNPMGRMAEKASQSIFSGNEKKFPISLMFDGRTNLSHSEDFQAVD